MDEAGEPAAGDWNRARVGAGTASMLGLRLSVAAPWQAGGPQCHVLLALDHLQPVGGAEDGEAIAAAPEAGGGAQQPSRYAARLAQCLQSLGITAATARLQDPPHPDYVAPASWEEPMFQVSYTTSTPKQQLTQAEIRHIWAIPR